MKDIAGISKDVAEGDFLQDACVVRASICLPISKLPQRKWQVVRNINAHFAFEFSQRTTHMLADGVSCRRTLLHRVHHLRLEPRYYQAELVPAA